MRSNRSQKTFGPYCKLVSLLLSVTGAAVAVVGAVIGEGTIAAIGFAAILAVIWMFYTNKPINKL